MKVSALIIGIDGWDKYTYPLVKSITYYEPACDVIVIDNASQTPYPDLPFVYRTERLCYSAAINRAAAQAIYSDWLVVLSNDVLCIGKFMGTLKAMPDNIVTGPQLEKVYGIPYIMGWCVIASARAWREIGGWDERFIVSSWEDVDFSLSAVERGFNLEQRPFPFIHLDQRQRFGLPEFQGTHEINKAKFIQKHSAPV